jgi:hypothetical protein
MSNGGRSPSQSPPPATAASSRGRSTPAPAGRRRTRADADLRCRAAAAVGRRADSWSNPIRRSNSRTSAGVMCSSRRSTKAEKRGLPPQSLELRGVRFGHPGVPRPGQPGREQREREAERLSRMPIRHRAAVRSVLDGRVGEGQHPTGPKATSRQCRSMDVRVSVRGPTVCRGYQSECGAERYHAFWTSASSTFVSKTMRSCGRFTRHSSQRIRSWLPPGLSRRRCDKRARDDRRVGSIRMSGLNANHLARLDGLDRGQRSRNEGKQVLECVAVGAQYDHAQAPL